MADSSYDPAKEHDFDPILLVKQQIRNLPNLPSHLKYLDEYDDSWRAIAAPQANNIWVVFADTTKSKIDFERVGDPDLRVLWKHFISWVLSRNVPVDAYNTFSALCRIKNDRAEEWFWHALVMPIHQWKTHWDTEWREDTSPLIARTIKLFLYFCCEHSIGGFRPEFSDLVRSFVYDWNPTYQGVVSGEAFLNVQEETKIISYLDDCSNNAHVLNNRELLEACLLCISYQHGLRPIQILRIELEDFRVQETSDGNCSVHFSAYRAKKMKKEQKIRFTRKIKQEWANIFVVYHQRLMKRDVWRYSSNATEQKLFPVASDVIVQAIADTVERLIGNRKTATHLRHTAALRLTDSGASLEEIAEFLGHSHARTSLVYFESSSTQAHKLNSALAISPIYSALASIAESKKIDKAALLDLPQDMQIAAVPHGIPVSGIGACNLGQSLCAKNPALSCYTCNKFLPVNDRMAHLKVLDDLRSVVRFFFDESHGEKQSPAFVQLKTTLASVQAIIKLIDIEAKEAGNE